MRKPIAILVMLAWLGFWIFGAVSVGSRMVEQPRLLQLLFYIAAGIGWVFPLRPLFLWMNAQAPPPED